MNFADIEAYAREVGCKCDLRPGMTYRELLEMEEGCRRGTFGCPGWICSALDKYREQVRKLEARRAA